MIKILIVDPLKHNNNNNIEIFAFEEGLVFLRKMNYLFR